MSEPPAIAGGPELIATNWPARYRRRFWLHSKRKEMPSMARGWWFDSTHSHQKLVSSFWFRVSI